MKMFIWKTRGLGTQYWVIASSVEEAQQKMRAHFDSGKILEDVIALPPKIRSVPDVIAVFDPSRTDAFPNV
jgi:hypothetical protein